MSFRSPATSRIQPDSVNSDRTYAMRTITTTREMWDEVRARAMAEELTMTQVVRRAIAAYLREDV